MKNIIGTRVKFIVFQGDIVAIFPDIIWNLKGDVTSYMRIGQHGPASKSLIRCKAAMKEQYETLLKELVGQGYDDLIVMNKAA